MEGYVCTVVCVCGWERRERERGGGDVDERKKIWRPFLLPSSSSPSPQSHADHVCARQ